jgi:hypothetical protein
MGLLHAPSALVAAAEMRLEVAPEEIRSATVSGNTLALIWGDGKVSFQELGGGGPLPNLSLGREFILQELYLSNSTPRSLVYCGFPARHERWSAFLSSLGTGPWEAPFSVAEARVVRPIGFVGNDVIWVGSRQQIIAMDATNGRMDWSTKTLPIRDFSDVKVSSDGSLIALCGVRGLECFARTGEKKWTLPVEDRRATANGDNCRLAPQPRIGDRVIAYDDSSKQIFSVDMASGEKFWSLGVQSMQDVLASSANGDVIIASKDSNPFAVYPHSGLQNRLDTVAANDFFFAQNGNLVVAIPSLLATGEDQATHAIEAARKNHDCEIFDPATGKLLRRLQLEQPRDK